MLKQRLITASILLLLFLSALFFLPSLFWSWLVLLVVLLGAWEWARLAGYSPPLAWGYLGVTAVLGWLALALGEADAVALLLAPALFFWICLVLPWLVFRWQVRHALTLAVLGWLVLLPTGWAMVWLREQGSPAVLLAAMAVVWIADSAAYFAGRRFGRHKLAPAVSPGKTWEGVAGGLAGVALFAATLGATGAVPLWGGMAAFIALAMLSVIGDLFESWMKRQAGLKDSGVLLPGHGGILDRIDGLTSALPLAALLWLLFRPAL